MKILILQTVGRTSWTRDQPAERPQPSQNNINTEKTQTSTIPVFEWANTVRALECAATVISLVSFLQDLKKKRKEKNGQLH
jgi:hypothetical protein